MVETRHGLSGHALILSGPKYVYLALSRDSQKPPEMFVRAALPTFQYAYSASSSSYLRLKRGDTGVTGVMGDSMSSAPMVGRSDAVPEWQQSNISYRKGSPLSDHELNETKIAYHTANARAESVIEDVADILSIRHW